MDNFLENIFGSKPEIAPYTSTDLPTEQLDAILANISVFPDIEKLGSLYQDYMTSGFEKAGIDINALLKGGSDSTEQMLAMAEKFLHGEIPQDVKDQVYRSTAFQSLMSGTAGSPMAGALTARDLGLTSLNLIGEGASLAGQAGNAAQRWAGLASGLIMSPSGMMITPQQQAAMTMQNNLYKQATQQLRNNVEAAPDPALQALNQWIEQVGGTIIGAYATGGMSKGGDYKTSYNANSYLGSSGTPQTAPQASPTYGLSKDSAAPPVYQSFGAAPPADNSYGTINPYSAYDFSGLTPATGIPEFNATAPSAYPYGNLYGVTDFNIYG